MKADIHPKYFDCTVKCGCGSSFQTRATVKELHIEICSSLPSRSSRASRSSWTPPDASTAS